MFKTLARKILAITAIGALILAPFLLLVDFDRYVPVVLTIWLLSAVYFVFDKSRH